MRNLEQQRAACALERVAALENKSDEFKKRYRAYVDRLGPAIIMNGLGQALATERAAAGSDPKNDRQAAHKTLYDNLQRWLCRNGGVYLPGDLLKAIVQCDQPDYLRAQAEALAWLEWHKKCCRAALPSAQGGGE